MIKSKCSYYKEHEVKINPMKQLIPVKKFSYDTINKKKYIVLKYVLLNSNMRNIKYHKEYMPMLKSMS